ncbi:acyltransferase family protein [Pseudoalteromonas phenolica]|uniref:acyltransferase family protein n=1 Tax=Pseudoalteromonas phenolica TaxID=161398 RepID=UPI001486C601|nr:acyltransferase family protein [Pseudoalteromonas phenolica]
MTTTTRLHYLDAVRAYALLLGIVYHASLSFLPIFIGWAVMDISTSDWVSVFVFISHAFRLEVFFLIAGFFSCMTLQKVGIKGFLTSRFTRIVLPFLLGWILLRPLLVSGWIMGAESMQGDANIIMALVTSFSDFNGLSMSLFVGTHLWFLYYLTLATILTLLLYFLHTKLSQFSPNLAGRIRFILVHTLTSKGLYLLVIPLAACCLWNMQHWGVDTPDKSLTPQWPVLCLYSGFFIFGWVLFNHHKTLADFTKLSAFKLGVWLCSCIAAVMLSRYQMQYMHEYYLQIKVAFVISYAVMMWTSCMLFIGLFKKIANKPNAFTQKLADTSYGLYLVHLPLVVWLQVAVAELTMPLTFKLFIICTSTVAISLLLIESIKFLKNIFMNNFKSEPEKGMRNQ